MIYVTKRNIKGKDELVLVSVHNSETNTYNTFKGIMASENVGIELHSLGVRFQIVSDDVSPIAGEETLVYPVLVSGSSMGSSDIKPIQNIFDKNNDFNQYERLAAALNQQAPGSNFTKELIESIFIGLRELQKYDRREEQYVINVERSFVESIATVNTITTYNSKRNVSLPFLTSEINRTHKMENEFDKLFVKIPKYETLMDTEDVSAMLPKEREIASPYPHQLYYTPHMLYAYDMIPKQRDEFLLRSMKGSGFSAEESLPKMDIKNLPIIPKKNIIGNSSNNTLDIRDEEKDFMEALRQYIKFDIAQNFPDRDVEEAYAKGTASPKMLGYLNELVIYFLRQNWTHNNKIEIGGGTLEDDDDADEFKEGSNDDAQEDTARFLYVPFANNHPMLARDEGIPLVLNFLSKATGKLGMDAMIEGIIRLARWGELKPSVLVLNGFNQYLDLNTLYQRNTTGNNACLKQIPFNGCKYELIKFISQPNALPDKKYIQENKLSEVYNLPVGVVLKLHLEEEQYQTVYMSLIELVNHYRKGGETNLVYGVTYEGGLFKSTIDPSLLDIVIPVSTAIRDVHKDEDSLYKIETSQDCKTVEIKASVSKGISVLDSMFFGFSMNNIMSNLGNMVESTSIPEAIDRASSIGQGVDSVLKVNVLKTILPIMDYVEKGSLNMDNISMEQLLGLYLKAMGEFNFISEFQFLSEISGGERKPVLKEEVTTINSFATSPKELVDPKEVVASAFITPFEVGEKIYGLYTRGTNPENESKLLCGVVVRDIGEPKKLQILVGASQVPAAHPRMNTDGIMVLAAALGSIAMTIHVGKGYTRFHSANDLTEIIDTFKAVM